MKTHEILVLTFMNLPFIYVLGKLVHQLMPAGIFTLVGYLSLLTSILSSHQEKAAFILLYTPLTTSMALLLMGNPMPVLELVLGYIVSLPTILLAVTSDSGKPVALQITYLASIIYATYMLEVTSVSKPNALALLRNLTKPNIDEVFMNGFLGDIFFTVLLAPSMIAFLWKLTSSMPLSTSSLTSSKVALKAFLIALLLVLLVAAITTALERYAFELIIGTAAASLLAILFYSREIRR